MKCICTRCGRKIESMNLNFDVTDIVKKELKSVIEEKQLGEDNRQLYNAIETLFNVWNQNDPIYMSENELWNLSEEKKMKGANKYIMLNFPYENIMGKLEKEKNPDLELEKNTINTWLKKEEELIKSVSVVLWLRKTGDGDIRFNEVLDDKSGTPFTRKRFCPFCGNEMSYWAGRYKEMVLTVLGGPRVSKSTTLTACAASFLDRDGDIVWEGHGDDHAWRLFNDIYLEKYRDGEPLKATIDNEDNIPKVTFKVTVEGRPLALTFIDLPGEFNNGEGVKDKVFEKYRYFYENVDFVWYCTDPKEVLQLEKCDDELGYDRGHKLISTEELKRNMAELSGFFKNVGKIVPVAYILGKTDFSVIDNQDKERYKLYAPNQQNCKIPLNIDDFSDRSQKVREYIKKNNPMLLESFETNFEKFCYIATSAYGYNPRNKPIDYEDKKAYQCSLPFLWMMALCSYIEISTVILVPGPFRLSRAEKVSKVLEDFSEREWSTAFHKLCQHKRL